jgi:glycosyltransferase involved in cell wall biosynthesis
MIVFFSDTLVEGSGWSKYSLDIVNILKNKEKVLVICVKKNLESSVKQLELLRDPIQYVKNPLLALIDFYSIYKVLKKISLEEHNILHITVEPFIFFLPFIQKFFKKKILTAHGSYSLILYNSLRSRFLFKFSLRFLNLVVYVSQYTKKKTNYIFSNNLLTTKVINNSIKPASINNYFNKKNNQFLTIASIKKRKGHHHTIEVARKLLESGCKDFCFKIIGSISDKEYYEILKKKVLEYKLKKFVFFKGFLDSKNIKKEIIRSKLFIMLSEDYFDYFEGYGLVYLEALNNGLNVVISKESGASHLKIPYSSGIVCAPNDYSIIASYLKKIIENKNKTNFIFNSNLLNRNWKNYKKEIFSIYDI